MGLFSRLTEKRIAAYQRELIETHYAEVENMYRQIRGWRHDFRNHIQTMKAYAAAEDWQAVRRYLDELDGDLAAVDPVIKTGNPMADAILNSKISLARSKDIPVTADAHIPVGAEAERDRPVLHHRQPVRQRHRGEPAAPAGKAPHPLYLDMKNTQLYLSFTNFTAGKSCAGRADCSPLRRGRAHGFGLLRTDAIVKRLGGYLSRNSEDGAFTTEILLPAL